MKFRIEKDSLGEVKVPQKALWGAQTQRALDNFTISGIKFAFPFGRSFIEALGIIKYSDSTITQFYSLSLGNDTYKSLSSWSGFNKVSIRFKFN